MIEWFDNDELFRQKLETGHRWARAVAERLQAEGIDARLTPLRWRNSIDDRHRFRNEQDVVVNTDEGQYVIEVKSRDLDFDEEPSSYPYDTAYVDTVSGWDQKDREPTAVVLVSQLTGGMLVVPVRKTRAHWRKVRNFDRRRSISDWWYEVDKQFLKPMSDLISWLATRSH